MGCSNVLGNIFGSSDNNMILWLIVLFLLFSGSDCFCNLFGSSDDILIIALVIYFICSNEKGSKCCD